MLDMEIQQYYRDNKCDNPKELVDKLILSSFDDIKSYIISAGQLPINSSNIPQYSSVKDGTINMIKYLRMSGDFGPSYVEIGQHYLELGHSELAYRKYGENHAKLSSLLGVSEIRKEGRLKRTYLTMLGFELEKRTVDEQKNCFCKLAGRIPIVRYSIMHGVSSDYELEKILQNYLSNKTAIRRRKNVWDMVVAMDGENIWD